MRKWNSVEEAYKFALRYLIFGDKEISSIDARKALDYCVAKKNVDAQYLSYALEYEKACQKGSPLSLENLRAAAESGIPAAQYDLAIHLFYGENTGKDIVQALNLMELAASRGYNEACRTLVRLYSFDSRIKRNPERANYWQDKLDGGSITDRYSLYPLSEKDVLQEEHTEEEKETGFDNVYGAQFEIVDQEKIINAPYHINILINAGPGTGKTYTLIQRISYLVKNERLNPENIVVFSFTRAVVKELKTRLENVFKDDNAAYLNVDISTFHKKAYAALQAVNKPDVFEDWKRMDLSLSRMMYDDCMIYGAELLEKHPDIIMGWEYVIIDEIQDINHAKAFFVLKLLDACKYNNIPYLLLGDSCQSIYDYLDDKNIRNTANVRITSPEFYKKLIAGVDEETKLLSFDIAKNFRSTEKIKIQALPVREAILEGNEDSLYGAVSDYANELTELKLDDIENFLREHHNDKVCLLERSNINTRYISRRLKEKGIQNYCVINSLHDAYPKWIGEVFSGFTDDAITMEILRTLFLKSEKKEEEALKCWNTIHSLEHMNSEVIPMNQLVYKLLVHELDDVIYSEKEENFVVSNIHRSKGLEYDYVLLDANILRKSKNDFEEARVLYVAMTRAKKETLKLVDTDLPYFRSRPRNNRHFRMKKYGKKTYRFEFIEICQNADKMDIGPENFVIPDMENSQSIIKQLKLDEEISLVYSEEEKSYAIVARDITIGWMKKSFCNDLNSISRNNYPSKFIGLYVDGVYTYIGQPNRELPDYENKVREYCPEIGVYRIWNYISFSGLAQAVYED